MKIEKFWFAALIAGLTLTLCFVVHGAWDYNTQKKQRHYFVSYSYQASQVASSGSRTWGYGHCDLKTDYDIATTAGIKSCIKYLRDQFIPEHDGPPNSVVIIHWFTTLK